MPPVDVPDLPTTSVEPVDEVLTAVEAIAQCVADGLNQVLDPAAFAQCVLDYMTPKTAAQKEAAARRRSPSPGPGCPTSRPVA